MSKDIDLRHVCTIIGLPIYVDVSSVPDRKEKDEIFSERTLKVAKISTLMRRAFEMSEPSDEHVKHYRDLDDES